MRVKICGITKLDQGQAIAELGATALGFICVRQSPRYVTPAKIQAIVSHLTRQVDRVGVFADALLEEIVQVVITADLNAVQLHGSESPQLCQQLRDALPNVEVIKALRVRNLEALEQVSLYHGWIDTLLLDAYQPGVLGGTGKTIDWASLQSFRPVDPWLLAGGLTLENVQEALSLVCPDGIDLSSGVELAPGDKDLQKVERLFEQLRRVSLKPRMTSGF
ncbi:MAG: phosphoribosylanthranilate isomerase [Cyanobacteria bacterium CRU_2_1]|nr:phosphoribosylanthranilate isomerase [Cyanobacteria bacterium RU_5_0]NJR62079.1 phosphoribosylanthranilate isomerase [Cyanobacteria bacterium CRU_2_1]